MKHKEKGELREIEVYDAQTRRLTAEGNTVSDFAQIGETGILQRLVEQTVAQMLGYSIEDVEEARRQNAQEGQDEADADAERQIRLKGAGAPKAAGRAGKGKREGPEPPPEAKKAPDGRHYKPDPDRPGKYLMWSPRA
jgi:hypothetical protein